MSNHDPFDIQGQERAKSDQDKTARMAMDEEKDDIKWLMSSKRGRRILWRLMDQSGVFRLSFNPNAMQMAFSEGNRNFGNRVLGVVHRFCPELYPTMVKEGNERNNSDHGNSRNDH